MLEYCLSPAAEDDLSSIWRYTNKEWGRAQANSYMLAVKAACTALAEAPQLAQGCDHIRPGYRRRGVGQHHIYFRTTSYGMAVIRILHQRMDAGRHL